jgi:hypothetical protein
MNTLSEQTIMLVLLAIPETSARSAHGERTSNARRAARSLSTLHETGSGKRRTNVHMHSSHLILSLRSSIRRSEEV